MESMAPPIAHRESDKRTKRTNSMADVKSSWTSCIDPGQKPLPGYDDYEATETHARNAREPRTW